ncbi:hypothetical protein ACFL21_03935 [Patescibacteria group bacterium]
MSSLERNENISSIELQKGRIDVVYGSHQSAQKFPDGIESNLEGLDFIALEKGTGLLSDPDFLMKLESNDQYWKIVEQAKNNEIPLIFPDLVSPEVKTLALKNLLLIMLEASVALGVFYTPCLREAYKKVKKQGLPCLSEAYEEIKNTKILPHREMTRRNVLKSLGSLALLGWAGSPGLAFLARNSSYQTDELHSETAALNKFSNSIHPELGEFILEFRNLAIAYKIIRELEFIYDSNELNDTEEKPHAALVIGFYHVGIEEILLQYQQGEITLDDMEMDLKKFNESYDSKNFATLGELFYNKNSGEWEKSVVEYEELRS